MKLQIFVINFCYLLLFNLVKSEETQCVLNGKKSLNFVSDKFISFSVDPAILLSGLNISETSRELGKYMSPAYVRIAGVSTAYLHFSEDEEDYQPDLPEHATMLTYTPSFWDSLNDWFSQTNLSMIFALNDKEKIEGKWNSKTIFPLLELTSQLDMNCLWQLGYDAAGQNFEQYKESVTDLRHIFDAFPAKKSNWNIVSNELDHWLKGENTESIRRHINSLKNSTYAVMWQGAADEEEFPEKDEMAKTLSSPIIPLLPIWTTIPKAKHPITFSSALLLAKQLGDAARMGYDVVFREPRLYELMTDTPNYWFLLFHKTLMGRNVLDIKLNSGYSDAHIFGHCTRKQNSFSRRGAITVLVVNNCSNEHTSLLKLPLANSLNTKHIEVQYYILTSDAENSTNIYSNGQKLALNLLKENLAFLPKLRRARVSKHLSLTVPAKSIGFFVLPDARIPICINDEDETNLIIEEIHEAQNTDFITTAAAELKPRMNYQNMTTLNELYILMKKELEMDEKYYHDNTKSSKSLLKINGRINENADHKDTVNETKSVQDVLKISDFGKTREEVMKKLSQQSQKIKDRHFKLMANNQDNFDDVTSREIEEAVLKVKYMLKDNPINSDHNKVKRDLYRRAKGRKFRLPSKRLDSPIMRKLRQRNSAHKGLNHFRRERVGQAHQLEEPARMKRYINMDLLREKLEKDEIPHKETLKEKLQKLKTKTMKPISEEDEEPEVKRRTTLQDLLKPKPLDLSKLLHLRINDKSNGESHEDEHKKHVEEKASKHHQSVEEEYLDEDGVEDEYADDFDESFQDDLQDYPDFYEKFGDDVKIVNPLFTKSAGKLGELDDEEGTIHKPLFRKEFVINHEDEDLVNKTIKNLEDYFSKSKGAIDQEADKSVIDNEYEDIDSEEETKPRTKREDKHFTQEDIIHYKQLMNTNIRHMKDNIRKYKLNLRTPKKDQVTLVQRMHRLKDAVEKAQKISYPKVSLPTPDKEKVNNILRKPKIDLDKFKVLNNVKFLKSRLAQHKLNNQNDNKVTQNENVRKQMSGNDGMDEDTKKLITLIKSELRNRRQRSIRDYEEKYTPNVQLRDNIRKPYVPMFRNKVRLSSRSKRYSRGFNGKLDDTVNSIISDGKYMLPKISKSSDFTLVLPTKDEISLVNSGSSSEIKFKHLIPTEKNTASTCPLETTTDHAAESKGTTERYYGNTTSSNTSSMTVKYLHHHSESNQTTLDKFFKSVNDFISNMHEKVKTYLKMIDD